MALRLIAPASVLDLVSTGTLAVLLNSAKKFTMNLMMATTKKLTSESTLRTNFTSYITILTPVITCGGFYFVNLKTKYKMYWQHKIYSYENHST
jgi:hypothetical protein